MTYDIRAKLYMDNSDYEKKLRQSAKQTESFGKSMKTIANGVKASFAGVAFIGITAVADALIDMTKAAAQDAKSQALLNKQMENSFKATKKQKEEMDKYIDSMSNLTGIADDNLRPAMSKIVAVSKNATKAQKSFAMVLDISAGTGKDVNVVAQAYSKYLGGNKTALDKLIPGLKDAGDKMGFIEKKYGGMAAIAGENDPFGRMNVVIDNFKEKLGKSFLPMIERLADWLASPEAQDQMDKFAATVEDMVSWFSSAEGKKAIKEFTDNLIKVADAINKVFENWQKIQPFLKLQDQILNPGRTLGEIVTGKYQNPWATPTPVAAKTGLDASKNGNITINVNAPNVSGKAVVEAVKFEARRRGLPLRLIFD